MADHAPPSQQAFWNSPVTRVWATEYAMIDARFAGLSAMLLDAAAPSPGERVLDVGCGSGSTVLALAERVGASGTVLGLDIAAESVAVAGARIEQAGFRQARVEQADAATHALPAGGFDLLFSRFGVMFFEQPDTAFANLHGALAEDGRVALLAWRPAAENPWATTSVAAIRDLLPPLPPPPGPEEPGQFAFGDAARVRRILSAAGFRDIALTPHDEALHLGADAAEATDFALRFGPAHRALAGASPERKQAAGQALLRQFAQYEGADGVRLPAAAWVITARA